MHEHEQEPKRYQCRHIHTDGRRCASPCLRHEDFCYFHHTTRRPVANPRQRRTRNSRFHLAQPEDRAAIQHSIGEVLLRIAQNEIDPKRAGLLLYGLQIASMNLPQQSKTRESTRRISYQERMSNSCHEEEDLIEEIVADPTLGPIAPQAELSENRKLTTVGALLLRLEQERKEKEENPPQHPSAFSRNDPKEKAEATPNSRLPATLPTLHATEDLAVLAHPRLPARAKKSRIPSPHRGNTPSLNRRNLLSLYRENLLASTEGAGAFTPQNPAEKKRGFSPGPFAHSGLQIDLAQE